MEEKRSKKKKTHPVQSFFGPEGSPRQSEEDGHLDERANRRCECLVGRDAVDGDGDGDGQFEAESSGRWRGRGGGNTGESQRLSVYEREREREGFNSREQESKKHTCLTQP